MKRPRLPGWVWFALAFFCTACALAAAPEFQPLQNLGATDPLRPGASSFNVTPTGEAVWSMPLWTPQGRNSIEPQLALSYRSRAANGFVGLHFSIDGFSSITRCWGTIAQDGGFSTGTQRGLPDKFCLDGKRLIERPNAPQFELQPELDPSIVVRVGLPLDNPGSFTVFYGDGRIVRFGSRDADPTTPANSILQGRALALTAPVDSHGNFTTDLFTESMSTTAPLRLAWFADRIEDHHGNFLEVDYERTVQTTLPGAVELVPKKIRWTGYKPPAGTTGTLAAPSRRVEFVYAATPKLDVRVGFQAGVALRRSKLLEKIQVFAVDGLVSDPNAAVAGSNAHVKAERLFREYRFAYRAVSPVNRSTDRLESMTECVFATAAAYRCLEPTQFTWTQETAVPQFAAAVQLNDVTDLAIDLHLHVPLFAADLYDMAVGDFDGDGRDDIVYRLPAMSGNKFSTADGSDPYGETDSQDTLSTAPLNTIGLGEWFMRRGTATGLGPRFALSTLPPTPGGDWKFSPRVLDVDGDGISELVLYSEPVGPSAAFGANQYQVFRGSCTSATSCSFAPINPLTEITAFPMLSGFPRRSFALQTGDLDGDGKIDFVHENATGTAASGDPTTLSFRAGVTGPTTALLAKVTMRIANPPPPSNGNIGTRLFDERHMVDLDGNGQPELVTLIDADSPLGSPRPFTFAALAVTGQANGTTATRRTTLHAVDIEASDAISSLLGHSSCRPPGDPTLRGMAVAPSGQTFQAYTRLNRYLVDVNGDGLRDSIATPAEPRDRCTAPPALTSRLFVSINTGADFRTPFAIPLTVQAGFNASVADFPNGPRSVDAGVRVADLDGDGRDDFLLVSENQFQVRAANDSSERKNIIWLQSTGSGFVPHDLGVPASWNTFTDRHGRYVTYGPRLAQVGDFNGDGLLDFVVPFKNNLTVTLQKPRLPDLVTEIRGGALTPARAITYARAAVTEPDVYSRGQCSGWPQTCLKSLGWVVKSTSIEALDFAAAAPTRNFTSYRYENARADVLGRGMLGVDKFVQTVHDGAATPKVFSTETLDFDLVTQVCQDVASRKCTYTNAGAPVRRTLEAPISPTRLFTSRTTTARALTPLPGGFGYRPTGIVNSTYDWETVGSPGTRMVHRATRTTSSFDSYGNVTSTLTEVSGSELPVDGTVQGTEIVYGMERKTTQPQVPDEGRWLIARYQDFQVVSTDPSLLAESQLTRTEHVEYEPNSVEIKSITSEPMPPVAESATTSGFTLTSTFTRNQRGSVTAVTQSGSNKQRTVTYAFHANDLDKIFPVSATDKLNHTSYSYNHAVLGVTAAFDDANGIRTAYEYDGLGRLKSVTAPGSAPTTFLYLKYPNSSLGGPRSHSSCYRACTSDTSCQSFDPAGRMNALQQKGFASTTFTYDRFGRLLKRSLPLIEFDRDGLGRVTAVRRPSFNATSTAYDGRRITSTDERAVVTKSDFDAKGRLQRQTTVEPVTFRDVVTRYEYGHFDRLRRIWHPILPPSQAMTPDPGLLVTRMTYDMLGRLESVADPDAGTVQRRYNAFGDLKRVTDANGAVTTYSYDDLGRVELIETPATTAYPARTANGMAQRARFVYDSAANGIDKLARVESNDGIEQRFEYDSFGRPRKLSWTVPGQATPFDFSYDYDALGQVEYLTYPGPLPFKLKYTYGTDGWISDVLNVSDPTKTATIWHQIARGAVGNSTEEQFGSTVHVTRRYDSAFRPKYVWGEFLPSGDMFQQLTYAWNPDTSLKARLDLSPANGVRESYGHDFLGRLERWTVQQNCLTTDWKYSYDDFGNLRSRETLPGVSFPSDVFKYTLPTDTLRPHSAKEVTTGTGTTATTTALTYDAAGHTKTGRGNTFTWSAIGVPWRIVDAAGTQQTLLYDGSGARIVSDLQTPQGTQRTITLGGLYELRTFGSPQVTEQVYNVFATDGVVAQVRRASGTAGEATNFIHRDHLGNADAITTEARDPQGKMVGALAERGKYEPFGERRFPWALAHPLRQLHAQRASQGFTGHEPDDALGLLNMRGRLYDPRLARFISPDPLINADQSQALNRYSYVWNSPAHFTDPSGFEGEVNDPEEWEPYPGNPQSEISFEGLEVEGERLSDPPLVQAQPLTQQQISDELSAVRFTLIEPIGLNQGPQLSADYRTEAQRIRDEKAFRAEYEYRQYLLQKFPDVPPEASWLLERIDRKYEGAPFSYVIDRVLPVFAANRPTGTFGPQRSMAWGAPVDPPRGPTMYWHASIGAIPAGERGKLDYAYGRATGSQHNLERTAEMHATLNKVDMQDTPANRLALANFILAHQPDPTVVAYAQITRGVLIAPGGSILVEMRWQGQTLATMILKPINAPPPGGPDPPK